MPAEAVLAAWHPDLAQVGVKISAWMREKVKAAPPGPPVPPESGSVGDLTVPHPAAAKADRVASTAQTVLRAGRERIDVLHRRGRVVQRVEVGLDLAGLAVGDGDDE